MGCLVGVCEHFQRRQPCERWSIPPRILCELRAEQACCQARAHPIAVQDRFFGLGEPVHRSCRHSAHQSDAVQARVVGRCTRFKGDGCKLWGRCGDRLVVQFVVEQVPGWDIPQEVENLLVEEWRDDLCLGAIADEEW